MRYETGKGHQAQLDWKENIEFVLDTGEIININIFVLIISYSRFRIYRLSLDKSQEIVFSLLTTNINFNAWDDIFYDPIIANAILDRVLHHAHVVSITGNSYRLKDHLNFEDN